MFHPVVQGFCGTLLHDPTVPAQHRGLALGGARDEQRVGVGVAA
jgi:hypothetical protein